jgi:2-dehydro-3-deoxyphosphogluconate aldolase/(4S)-4-hydroxy-2-oxoglutarate aldolase
MTTVLDRIRDARAVPVLRSPSADQALADARLLIDAGFTALELTFSTPDVSSVIAELASTSDVLVGAGTVLSRDQAEIATAAGAGFLVSPVFPEWFLEFGREVGILAVPGCATPTELFRAHEQGAGLTKVFPITRLGGIDYLRDVLAPMPALKLMVTGGVRPQQVPTYLEAGAVAVGLGSILRAGDPRDVQAAQARDAAQLAGG